MLKPPADLFLVIDDYFLERVDYFSEYNILKKEEDGKFGSVMNDVDRIAWEGSKLFAESKNSGTVLVVVNKEERLFKSIGEAEGYLNKIGYEPNLKKPWAASEILIMSDFWGLTLMLLKILAAVLVFWFIMRFFDLKPFWKH